MRKPLLVIGYKNYSSWSLRAWLLLKHFGIEFDELRVHLYRAEDAARRAQYCPTGQVPVLHDGPTVIWESLAICEYLADRHPEMGLWPVNPATRAHARSISAEMHAGFTALRRTHPLNCRARGRRYRADAAVIRDVARINALWNECLNRYGGPWLCGRFSIADAMYAPVASRFVTYGIPVQGVAAEYSGTMLAHPAMQLWYRDAEKEVEVLDQYEQGR
ncbi:MAG: glutathione S-transferase family protein [Nevskiales bacterium]